MHWFSSPRRLMFIYFLCNWNFVLKWRSESAAEEQKHVGMANQSLADSIEGSLSFYFMHCLARDLHSNFKSSIQSSNYSSVHFGDVITLRAVSLNLRTIVLLKDPIVSSLFRASFNYCQYRRDEPQRTPLNSITFQSDSMVLSKNNCHPTHNIKWRGGHDFILCTLNRF